MAQIDASGLTFAFNAFTAANVQHFAFASSSAGHYTWVTGNASPFYRITALSFAGNVTTMPLAGTIDSINVTDNTYAPGFGITGLSASLASLIHTSDAAVNQERFWETVLAGATTIIMPSTGTQFHIMGDFVTVNAGQTLVGAADTFVGSGTFSTGVLAGDAAYVEAGATLTGGNDTFNAVSNTAIIGDVGNGTSTGNLGTVNGGNDTVTLIDTGYSPTLGQGFVIGDVYWSSAGSTTRGGSDTITLRDVANANYVFGDNYASEGATIVGGADTILIETTIAGRAFVQASAVLGDDLAVAAGGTATGGNDTITLNNVNSAILAGDYVEVSNSTATGGNDTITYASTFAETTPAPSYPITSVGEYLVGDTYLISAGATFTGGHDTITVLRVQLPVIAGDIYAANSAGAFTGGNDAINVLFNRTGMSPGNYSISGDAETSASGNFRGGDDVLNLNVQAALPGGTFLLYGDTRLSSSASVVRNGNDVLRVTANAYQGATLYGDSASITSGGSLTVVDGNDTLTGGAGHDVLYGDTALISWDGTLTYTGGNDFLDGRGGNDLLYGGEGIDTAVFSSLAQSVYVNLNGIPESALGDLYEAIGQGNDQLVSIENVIGSSLADTIIGDAGYNVIEGGAGADRINGMGGEDTASYASSNAGVVVNLATGVTAGGHAQGDVLVSIERLIGSAHADTLVGTAGANVLDGGGGADNLRGLGGNDIYIIDHVGDVVDESFTGSGGTDTVRASVSVDLADTARFKGAVENVTLLPGVAGLNATGNSLANAIAGNALGNTLNGGLGSDTLTGGGGADKFVFSTALGPSNVDTITDFSVVDDLIHLDDAVFAGIGPLGTLAASRFHVGAAAADAANRIIYNSATGNLFYDADGNGAGAAVQFAKLTAGLALTAADFVVI